MMIDIINVVIQKVDHVVQVIVDDEVQVHDQNHDHDRHHQEIIDEKNV